MRKIKELPLYGIMISILGVLGIVFMLRLSLEEADRIISNTLIGENPLLIIGRSLVGEASLLSFVSIIAGVIIASLITKFILIILRFFCDAIDSDYNEDNFLYYILLAPVNCAIAVLSAPIWNDFVKALKQVRWQELIEDATYGKLDALQFMLFFGFFYVVCYMFRFFLPAVWGVILYIGRTVISLVISIIFIIFYAFCFQKVEFLMGGFPFSIACVFLFYLADAVLSFGMEEGWGIFDVAFFEFLFEKNEENKKALIITLLRFINGLLWLTIIGGVVFGGFMQYLISLAVDDDDLSFENISKYFYSRNLWENFKLSLFMGFIRIISFVLPFLATSLVVFDTPAGIIILAVLIGLLPGLYLRVLYSQVHTYGNGFSCRERLSSSRSSVLEADCFFNKTLFKRMLEAVWFDIRCILTTVAIHHSWWYHNAKD